MAVTTTTTHPSWCCRDELSGSDPQLHRSERVRVDRGVGGAAEVRIEQRAGDPGTRIVLTTDEGGEVRFTPEAAREVAIVLLRQNYAALGR